MNHIAPSAALGDKWLLNGDTCQRETDLGTMELGIFQLQTQAQVCPVPFAVAFQSLCSKHRLGIFSLKSGSLQKKSLCNFNTGDTLGDRALIPLFHSGLQPSFGKLQTESSMLVVICNGAARSQDQHGSWCWGFVDTEQPKCQKDKEKKNLFKQFFPLYRNLVCQQHKHLQSCTSQDACAIEKGGVNCCANYNMIALHLFCTCR